MLIKSEYISSNSKVNQSGNLSSIADMGLGIFLQMATREIEMRELLERITRRNLWKKTTLSS